MMKTPAEILKKNENGLQQPSWISKTQTGNVQTTAAEKKSSDPISLETKALVNLIFARFMAIYGHKFKSCFETQEEIRIAKREWALSLAAFSEMQLVTAVDRCKETLAWMPTVSEFLKILETIGAGDGVPGVRQAYIEACRYADHPTQHQWSHPVVYHAGREAEWFRLRSEEERVVFPVFSYHYEMVVRRFRQGELLDQPHPQAITDNRDATLYAFIREWSQSQSISEEQAASLLYYLTKPEGSRARASYKKKAEQKVSEMNLSIKLPDNVESVG
ncbi:replication protein P [Neptunomonas qingdaonensis]|nr:replication protein P [Neptunomonas qingdaonensis]